MVRPSKRISDIFHRQSSVNWKRSSESSMKSSLASSSVRSPRPRSTDGFIKLSCSAPMPPVRGSMSRTRQLRFAEAEQRICSFEGQAKYAALEGWWRKSSHRKHGAGGYWVPEDTALSEALRDEMENAKCGPMLRRTTLGPEVADIDSLEFHKDVPRRQKTGIGRKAKPTDFVLYRSGPW